MPAPNFCMLLRKHINNGRITDITQPKLERILRFEIEHLDELGDLCKKYLIVEIMGKHSNIIFCNENDRIIDSIKHVSAQMSSIREVLPGRDYFIPETVEKLNPLDVNYIDFNDDFKEKKWFTIEGDSYMINPIFHEDILYFTMNVSAAGKLEYEGLLSISLQAKEFKEAKIIDKLAEKYVVDSNDYNTVKKDVYDWCDVYGHCNANFSTYSQSDYPKLVVLCPSFGVRCWNIVETIHHCVSNLFKFN